MQATRRQLERIAPVTWLSTRGRQLPETPGYASRATWAKLLLPELLPPDVERLLYFDADMIALRDIAGVWQAAAAAGAAGSSVPSTTCSAAAGGGPQGPAGAAAAGTAPAIWAVRDFGLPCGHEELQPLGWRMDSAYFNAGPMLLDWTCAPSRRARRRRRR